MIAIDGEASYSCVEGDVVAEEIIMLKISIVFAQHDRIYTT